MDELAVLRLTSSRPVYRRGGVQLSNVPVDIQRGQDGGILSPEAMLALLRDPVVKMQTSADGETFTTITDAERAEIAENIEALLVARAGEAGTDAEFPDGTGPDAKTVPDGSADQAKVGDAKEGIPAADTSATSAPAAGTGADISADGGAVTGEAEKAAAGATAAEENNGGVDAKPAPVAAADAQPKPPQRAKGRRGSK